MLKFFMALLLVASTCFGEAGPGYLFSRANRSVTITGTLGDGIPPSYSSSNPKSKTMTGLERYGHLKVWNSCTTPILVNVNFSSAAPTDGDPGNIFVPASSGLIEDNLPIAGAVYQRSFGAALENCYTVIEVW